MAKYKRTIVGSVCKGKKNEETGVIAPDYIQVSNDVTLKRGDFLNLESKKMQQENLDSAVKAGRLGGDAQTAIQERIDKIPDFVRFQIVRIEKQN